MKKTINGLLLAMAVCSGSAYGRVWEDDKTVKEVLNQTLNDIEEPAQKVKSALEAIRINETIKTLGQLLMTLGVKTLPKTPEEMITKARLASHLLNIAINN